MAKDPKDKVVLIGRKDRALPAAEFLRTAGYIYRKSPQMVVFILESTGDGRSRSSLRVHKLTPPELIWAAWSVEDSVRHEMERDLLSYPDSDYIAAKKASGDEMHAAVRDMLVEHPRPDHAVVVANVDGYFEVSWSAEVTPMLLAWCSESLKFNTVSGKLSE